LTLTGTGDASTTVAVLNGTTQFGTTTVGTGGTWSLSFSTTSSVRTLTAVGSDAAGNKSSATSGSVLVGTSGANTLTATAGNDLFYGGSGADTFTFTSLFGHDVIADFAATGSAHDVINFHGSSVLNSFANVMAHAAQVGSGVVITQDASNVLTLNNVTKTALTSADFKFV
jgi:Ca2+-binding RTX toxin-like protein